MYTVVDCKEAEKVANCLLIDVDFVIVSGVQFHDVKSISITQNPNDKDEMIVSIDLGNKQYATISYYKFENKCQFSTLHSESSALIIGVNNLSDEEAK